MNKDTIYKFKKLSSLYKVFCDEEPREEIEAQKLTALKGENVSFQIAYTFDFLQSRFAKIKVKSPLLEYIRVRQVLNVPCQLPANLSYDDNYLRTKPGMYPDLLRDLEDGRVLFVAGQWHSLWIDIDVTESAPVGNFPVIIDFYNYNEGELLGSVEQEVIIYDVSLPKQTLIRTEWFHGDSLAEYYNVEVFSEEHWLIMENFIKTAVKRGCNMILTPHFTPPLDTAKGHERTTIQLVDIFVKNRKYYFSFEKMERWVMMCKDLGITHFEMSHLFTQWGAIAAPKIMATVNGEYKQIFGWKTPATGVEYIGFLHSYLPELIKKLNEWNIANNTFFHISDEPNLEQLESYIAAKDSVKDLLRGFVVMDALSDYEFYKIGVVEKPVCANNHIHSFLDNGAENIWSYYCTAQSLEVSNRFFSMPSSRTRIYGIQLYKYSIEGTLHWGYNFYNAQDSVYKINPYFETCAAATYPGGDSFLVYPKEDFTPEESIRIMVLDEAMNDLRALQLLEVKIGKDAVMDLLEGELLHPITFRVYPKSGLWLIYMRNNINELLNEL